MDAANDPAVLYRRGHREEPNSDAICASTDNYQQLIASDLKDVKSASKELVVT